MEFTVGRYFLVPTQLGHVTSIFLKFAKKKLREVSVIQGLMGVRIGATGSLGARR